MKYGRAAGHHVLPYPVRLVELVDSVASVKYMDNRTWKQLYDTWRASSALAHIRELGEEFRPETKKGRAQLEALLTELESLAPLERFFQGRNAHKNGASCREKLIALRENLDDKVERARLGRELLHLLESTWLLGGTT